MPRTTPIWSHYQDTALKLWAEHNSANPAKSWTRERILREVVPLQRKALVLAFLVGQVNNGGFYQWHTNDYSFSGQEVAELLEEIGTPDCLVAAGLVKKVLCFIANEDDLYGMLPDERNDLDNFDDTFYALENLDQEIEAYIRKLANTGPEELVVAKDGSPVWISTPLQQQLMSDGTTRLTDNRKPCV